MVFGRHIGNVKGQEMEYSAVRAGSKIWRHDANSFGRMWDHVGRETGTTWKTWAELYDVDKGQEKWVEDGTKLMRFEVERVA